MGPRTLVLLRILVTVLVFQFGLAGTAGWLHLAAHEHAFSPDLHTLVDTQGAASARPGVSATALGPGHCGVLLALSQDTRERERPSASSVTAPLIPCPMPPRDLLPQRNPGQQPILALAPSLSPPLA